MITAGRVDTPRTVPGRGRLVAGISRGPRRRAGPPGPRTVWHDAAPLAIVSVDRPLVDERRGPARRLPAAGRGTARLPRRDRGPRRGAAVRAVRGDAPGAGVLPRSGRADPRRSPRVRSGQAPAGRPRAGDAVG